MIKAEFSTTKIQNFKKVFRCIQYHKSITRRRIQEETGLSWGAVSQFCNVLLTSSIAVEGNIKTGNVGKSAVEITFNPDNYFVIGLHFTSSHAYGALLNMLGEELNSYSRPITDPEKILEYLEAIVKSILERFGVKKQFLVIGVSVPGSTDVTHGILKHSIFCDKWTMLKIRETLEVRFHIPVFVYADTECTLAAEKYFGIVSQEKYTNAALVSLNYYGIGMAWMHHSRTYYSEQRHQCELGHLTVHPNGTLCNCGKRGCLEMYASHQGITTQYREAVSKGHKTDLDMTLDNNSLYNAIALKAKQGDSLSLHLFQQAGELLGNACATVCSLLEPEVLIIYGILLYDGILWKEEFERQFHTNVFPHCHTKITYSKLTSSAAMIGAAFTALDALLGHFLAETLSKFNIVR